MEKFEIIIPKLMDVVECHVPKRFRVLSTGADYYGKITVLVEAVWDAPVVVRQFAAKLAFSHVGPLPGVSRRRLVSECLYKAQGLAKVWEVW